jgi:fructuronate reductase
MERLSNQTLPHLPRTVRLPAYPRNELAVGLAHIGVGAFHRCHQAEFTDDMLEARFGRWGIVGINLKPPRLAKLLAPQNGLFTRTLRQGAARETRVIGAIVRTIDIEDDAGCATALDSLAAPTLCAVTLTVTEKGYCHVPATGMLDWGNPQLRLDVEGARYPQTVLGLVALGLERRRAAGAKGLTLVSCDNVPSNGTLLRRVLLEFAEARSRHLAAWIEDHVRFPSTMVDRIVPATSEADHVALAHDIALRDEAAVVGETFRQWVIEDQFAGERPPWDLAGAQFVSDAKPYELVKMRVLNAAQSTLSHLGAILGYAYSFEAASDPLLAALTRRMLASETSTTLPRVEGMETRDYIEKSLARIKNTAIFHRCHQIGTDGSQKIVQRLADPLRERLARGEAANLLLLGVASWLAYCLCGARPFGQRWPVCDPWANRIFELADEFGDNFKALAEAALAIGSLFASDLAVPEVVDGIARHLAGLLATDPRAYLSQQLLHD